MKGVRGEIIAGRYEVGEQVGSGGFGTVYAGRQLNLNRDVAIKVMRQGPEGSAVSRERFRREAVLSSGFSHPNIVTYHDFVIDDDGDMILVMEYLRGVTLDAVIAQDGRLEIGRAARIIAEVAAGLAECHRAGIVHRDIKPSNIFLLDRGTPRERAKIIDFGILWAMPDPSAEIQGLTRDNAFIGTPEYVAPEVLVGAYPDGRTDQYALALVALRAMTGELPFKSSKGPALLDRIAGRPPVLGSQRLAGAPAVKGVLYKALSPEPGDRFGDLDEFARAMAAAAGVVPGMVSFPAPTPGVFGADSGCADDTVVEVRAGYAQSRPVEPVVPAPAKHRLKVVAAFVTVAVCAVIAGVAMTWGLLAREQASLPAGAPDPRSRGVAAEEAPVIREVIQNPAESAVRPQATGVSGKPVAAETSSPDVAAKSVVSKAPPSPLAAGPVVSKPRAPAVAPRVPVSKASSPVVATGPVVSKASSPAASPAPVPAAIPEFGTLEVQAMPFADVWIGGRNMGRTPVNVSLPAGRYTIEVRSEIYGSKTRTVEVFAGKPTKETVYFKE